MDYCDAADAAFVEEDFNAILIDTLFIVPCRVYPVTPFILAEFSFCFFFLYAIIVARI